ncbi:MAG: hypothetical protein FJW96_02440 [Actinobacteria bacterium]|nr:hypothetical protein [Actinomycetota bacterium]
MSTVEAPVGKTTSGGSRVLDVIERFGPLIFLVAIWIFFAAKKFDTFPTWDNLLLILSTAALPGIVSFGLTMTLIVGEFDLSIGSCSRSAG